MDYNSLLELVKARRSYRKIKPQPIPDEYVEKLIEVARWAPSGLNLQPWEFIVLKDRDLIERISQAIYEYRVKDFFKFEAMREDWQGPKWKLRNPEEALLSNAPVFIVVCGDKRVQVGLPMAVRYTKQKLESVWESSLANTFLYMHLAATTLGLATHWTTAVKVPLVQCQIKDCLGIPSDLEIYELLGVGYPDEKPIPKPVRDLKDISHYDYCGPDAFRTDKEIREFIINMRGKGGTVERH